MMQGVGEFAAIETTPAATHITFKDRKTAETFLIQLDNNTLPGVEGTLKVTWVPNSASRLRPDLIIKDEKESVANAHEAGGAGDSATDVQTDNHNMLEDGEVIEEDDGKAYKDQDERDMDYEVADDNEWGS